MRTIFFTIRFHPNDSQAFEDYVTLLIPFVESHNKFSWCIEKDHSVNRHFHSVMVGPYKDLSKFRQKLSAKKYIKYKEIIKRATQTSEHGWDTQMIPEDQDDLKKVLGYTLKHDETHRCNVQGYTLEEQQDAVAYYYADLRIQAMAPPAGADWRIPKVNQLHQVITQFCEEQGIDFLNPHLHHMMRQQKISTVQVPAKQFKHVLRDLQVSSDQYDSQFTKDDALYDSKNYMNDTEGSLEGMTFGEYMFNRKEAQEQADFMKMIWSDLSPETQLVWRDKLKTMKRSSYSWMSG